MEQKIFINSFLFSEDCEKILNNNRLADYGWRRISQGPDYWGFTVISDGQLVRERL